MDVDSEGRVTQEALANSLVLPIPRFYMNGFVFGQSLSDVAMVVQTNGSPSTIVNMSFTTAKTLARDLGELIAKFEKTTSHEIMTMQDVQSRQKEAE